MRMPPGRCLLKNIELWSHDSVRVVNLEWSAGFALKIEEAKSSEKPRFALVPSGVDPQVHLRVPGQEYKEEPETAIRAALCGGYGAVLSMPNTKPVVDTVEVVQEIQRTFEPLREKYGVHVYISAAITKGLKGLENSNYQALAEAGVRAFTDDGLGVVSDERMRSAYAALEELQLPLLQHAEFPGHGGVLAPSAVQKALKVQAYEAKAEIDMLKRDLELLKEFPKMRYHLLHATAREAVALIKDYKQKMFNVSAEVSPHHLYFSSDQIDPENTAFKMNPPIRASEDREALRAALRDRVIDFVATDHAPHSKEDKGKDFSQSAFGTVGLETAFPVLYQMFQSQELTAERLVDVFSFQPARFLGLDSSWGQITEGQVLRAIVIDKEAPSKKFSENQIHSKSKNSCFLGEELPDVIAGHFTEAGFFRFKDSFEVASVDGENDAG